MKRRSFLAMLGLAPLGVGAANATHESLQDGVLISDLETTRMHSQCLTHTWTCPAFVARRSAAHALDEVYEPSQFAMIDRDDVPEWLRERIDAGATQVYVAMRDGRIVQATWWAR